MKTRKKWLLLFVALVSIGLLTACTSTSTSISSTTPSHSITVQGSSSISVPPTIAKITIGVRSFNEDVKTAQNENATKMEQVFQALGNLGIAKEKIKTVSYDISQRMDYTEMNANALGYDVVNLIEVTLEDFNLVSQVIDVTVSEGVNQANFIVFSLSDEESQKVYQQALTQAVAAAKAKAETLATASGVKIDKPLSVTENLGAVPIVRYESYDAIAEKAGIAGTPVSGGELQVEASVTVIYGY